MDKISSIAESLAFEHLMNLVVFFNSVLFALEYHGMSESYAARLYLIENFLMLVYGTEFIIIAAAAGGLFSYLQNPWNRLDFVLLVIACVEFLLLTCSVLLYTDSYARGIFVLRLFRLVRPFRVVRQNNKLLLVLDAILSSVPAFLSSIAFHLLLNSVFAVVGMNLFEATSRSRCSHTLTRSVTACSRCSSSRMVAAFGPSSTLRFRRVRLESRCCTTSRTLCCVDSLLSTLCWLYYSATLR